MNIPALLLAIVSLSIKVLINERKLLLIQLIKMKKKLFLILFSLFILTTSFIHPFYVSTINLAHNKKDKTIEITLRSFIDDIESALKKNFNKPIDLSKPEDNEEANKLLKAYLKSNLSLQINHKLNNINFLGYEINKESVWIYAEINNIESLQNIDINCKWLYDFTTKQSNILSATYNNIEKSFKLDYPKNLVQFNW